jgi:transposase-like protein
LTSGTIEVKRPRVRGLEERFESAILPLFARRTQEVGQLLPELYLHGLSQGDFELALRGLLGAGAPLSPSSIARLRDKWIVEYNAWSTRRLDDRELVYAWADVLRDRGLAVPVLLAADGHLGIWTAVAEIWPHTAEQRCWNHRILNVLNKLPKSAGTAHADPYTRPPVKKRRNVAINSPNAFEGSTPDAAALLERDLGPHGDVLRLSRSPLATPAHYKRYRESLRIGAASN